MNSNTRIKIRVPKSLYESVKNEIKGGVKHEEHGQYYAKAAVKGLQEEQSLNESMIMDIISALRSVDAETLGMIATMLGIGIGGAKIGKKLSQQSNPTLDKTMGDRSSMHEKKKVEDKKAQDKKVEALAEAIKNIMQEKKKKKAEADKKKKEAEAEKKKKEAAMAKKKEAAKKK